ncbi:conserved hypothetical protein [Brochothrix thermosphacta]|uniref:BppU family phage baseplate upper protein n=1 Tax=Brochothrix thermosphacta TaxID=2756 RepID=UPI000D798CF9|nr:BppU family phage baseplate upper protein [Brochothrix thermosphacta]SPP25723.1 conserved hypothetical protein [Brochothrix thermosphacta]
MSIKKIATTKMEITSDYQTLSDLNVAFYNQDINTSLLRFTLTRCGKGLHLSQLKIDTYIMLVAQDGSKVRDYLNVFDDEKGIVSYTIPDEFLKHTGRVIGQVYLYQNDNILVSRTFAFVIKDSLVNSFSAETKLEYIKTFDDLQTQIQERVDAIEEAIANGEDYVAQMIEMLDTGKKEIASTVVKANTDINKVATDAKNNVTVTADTATKNITNTATKATTDINKVATDATKKITDTSNIAVSTVDAKVKEVTDAIAAGEVSLKKDTFTYTDGKGFSRPVPSGTTDWLQISTAGNYSITRTAVPTNAPPSGVYFNLIVNTRTSTTRDLTAINIFNGAIYTNAMTGVGAWSGWEKLVTASELAILDTKLNASQPVTLWQGAAKGVSNTAYNLTKAINTFRVAMVTYKTASGNNKVQTYSVATDSSRMIISETNLSDADASSAWLYECHIDSSASTSFKIIADNLFNIKTGVATVNANTHTILKIEGVM